MLRNYRLNNVFVQVCSKICDPVVLVRIDDTKKLIRLSVIKDGVLSKTLNRDV